MDCFGEFMNYQKLEDLQLYDLDISWMIWQWVKIEQIEHF